jgi:hypothetical protein
MAFRAAVRLGLPQVKLDDQGNQIKQYDIPVHTGETTVVEVGERVTIPELHAHGQSDDQIAGLVAHGSLIPEGEWKEGGEDVA